MSDYERLAALDVHVEGYDVDRRELAVSPEFTRVTTTVKLNGAGETGSGEDVSYSDQPDYPADLDIAYRGTLGEFSTRLDDVELPYDYSRWAFEAAALDLALRQAGLSLADAVGREARPVRFVVSSRAVDGWLTAAPELEFKVDPTSEWTREYMEQLGATGRVRVIDFKGYYKGTVVDQPADPRLYAEALEAFPDAVVEDAAFTDETRPILERALDRLSFDAPIHSVDDVLELEVMPPYLNVKPSRFGTLRRLLECLAYGERAGISMYGGGQFELGVGRKQIQKLASLYYATAPNDVAPSEYNVPPPRGGLPGSPLETADDIGF